MRTAPIPRRQLWLSLALTVAAIGCGDGGDSDADAPHSHARDAGLDAAVDASEIDADVDAGPFVECEIEIISRYENSVLACDKCAPGGGCADSSDDAECLCDTRHNGELCDRCNAGFIEHEGQCMTPCEAADFPCAGTCTGTIEAPACECNVGYEGDDCELCADGFETDPEVAGGLACMPTCDGACAAEEVCTATSDSSRCVCMVGYDRDEDGHCVWRGLLEDPGMDRGCAAWRLVREGGNEGDLAIAELTRQGVHLAVDHRCATVGVRAIAYIPAAHTLPGAALSIEARGKDGSVLRVGFAEHPHGIAASGDPGVTVTPEWQHHVLCIPVSDAGKQATLALSVGAGGLCSDALAHDVEVRGLEVIRDERCRVGVDPPQDDHAH